MMGGWREEVEKMTTKKKFVRKCDQQKLIESLYPMKQTEKQKERR
jgi:hypothetical protein